MTFNDWFNGQELYGLRSERLHAMLDAFSSKDLLFQALLPWLEQAYDQGRSDERSAEQLRKRCNALLTAMLGDATLVKGWWTTKNKAFKSSTPASVFDKDPVMVYSYLMRTSEGEW